MNKPFYNRFSKPWKKIILLTLILPMLGSTVLAVDSRSADPYYSAVVMDASTGQILWEDHAGAEIYPASIAKLLNVYVVLDDVATGTLRLDEPVQVTREAEEIGGRQVWLREGEIFPLSELLVATLVHSANDAATALAIRASGSKAAHAERMNEKAREIGMRSSRFYNVHGLPPGPGQLPDVSSAIDLAILSRSLIAQHPDVLDYTSVSVRDFRPGNPVRLTSSNKLLASVDGCDGLKTGYFRAGGFSIAATAERNGARVIAVVAGCKSSNVRNQWAERLLERGFSLLNSTGN